MPRDVSSIVKSCFNSAAQALPNMKPASSREARILAVVREGSVLFRHIASVHIHARCTIKTSFISTPHAVGDLSAETRDCRF